MCVRVPAQRRVDRSEDRRRHLDPREHTRRLLVDPRTGDRVGTDDGRGRYVARADVLREREVDQLLHAEQPIDEDFAQPPRRSGRLRT
jgi:hypothetical protein